jgi:hypothetical protein
MPTFGRSPRPPRERSSTALPCASLRFSQLPIDAPFQPVVKITLTSDPRTPGLGVDRIGTASNCRSFEWGMQCDGGGSVYGSATQAFLVPPP